MPQKSRAKSKQITAKTHFKASNHIQPQEGLGANNMHNPNVSDQLWFEPLKEDQDDGSVLRTLHITPVKICKGGFLVLESRLGNLFNWSKVESCPRCG